MKTLSPKQFQLKIDELQKKLTSQEKISKALLERVKKDLKYQLNTNETFEHNTYLLNQIKTTKTKLFDEAQASEKFAYLARHDSLTGLYNRDFFNKHLKNCVLTAQNNNETHALIFLDLDQFKIINDTAGHLAGDEMIKQIANILLRNLFQDETLSRLGGDEFGIIIKNCTPKTARQKADVLLATIEKFHFSWSDKIFTVTASIGLIMIDKNTISHIDVQKNVDIACYAAKNAGRNRIHFYQEKDHKLLKHHAEMQWVPILSKALQNGLFCLYTQPIKSTDPSIEHLDYEILIRLKHKNQVILPGVFLPPAERYNLIIKIDSWVIRNTFKWLAKNVYLFHPQTHFSINLSGQSLGDEDILTLIIGLLEENRFPGNMVHFEVTETMAISNLQSANNFINKIKKYGCGFSLDDFGSGLSSLSYLKNLDVDTLKIDGVFIRDILKDKIDEEMVNSINNIGHVMGMKTIAEFVQEEKIATKLIEMGIDYLQGHSIGKPIPIEDLLDQFTIKAPLNKQAQ